MIQGQILVLPGDGIGPEVIAQSVRFIEVLNQLSDYNFQLNYGMLGGCAIDAEQTPLPDATLAKAKDADAVLLGAVGGEKWDGLPQNQKPEKGLLGMRSGLSLFANLRPAILYPELAASSSLKDEVVAGLDILIVRELTGGIYFGEPRGVEGQGPDRKGFNTYVYTQAEIERIARVAFDMAAKRGGRVCSIDKANVLEATAFWREVVTKVAESFPAISLSHMYVDNAAMQLVRAPKQFDVIVTGNLFGDILSDLAAMLTGSLGMLPSASLAASGKGMYEPVHGSAPDIAGQGIANPLATILSLSMMMRYTFQDASIADAIDGAVGDVLKASLRTQDIMPVGGEVANIRKVGTEAMGDAALKCFQERLDCADLALAKK